MVTRRARRTLVIQSPHAHADALHLLQPDGVLKRPIERTFDLDQVAVRAVEGSVVVTACPEIIGVKRVVEQACYLARVSFRSLQDVRVRWWRHLAKHALPTSNLLDSDSTSADRAACSWVY